ncbi:MAG: histidinol-phosphate transaminase [Candidatus Sumerlaeaceae bacterium]|nr:histidinol-phosphate transaminase [Candidatus Sumerlaeaceae bacterium]
MEAANHPVPAAIGNDFFRLPVVTPNQVKTMSIEINAAVAALEAYVPGEQPREPGFVKLNTNESPYPSAPAVVEAVHAAATEAAFNKYPDPASRSLRQTIAESLGVELGQILAGNGSDEVLRLVCHAFLRPGSGDVIGMLDPTYVLYRTLAEMFGSSARTFATVAPDYAIPEAAYDTPVKVFFLANPNPPIGTLYPLEQIERLAADNPARLIVVDEAYVDFSGVGNASISLVERFRNVLVSRTFSKSYSLAGLRVGYIVGRRALIAEMEKIRDSYNLNRVSQAAAEAAFRATEYYADKTRQICEDRAFLTEALRRRGFEVPESRGNFVFARRADAAELYKSLKERKILVRYFSAPNLADGLRITIGTRTEINTLLEGLDALSK